VSIKKAKWAGIILLTALFLQMASPLQARSAQAAALDAQMAWELAAVRPVSLEMIDVTLAGLNAGWAGMSPAQQALFLIYFDPAGTGEVDEAFISAVRENYRRIEHAFAGELPLYYEPHSRLCQGMRLYYTDLVALHVCPYYLMEMNDLRKARTLIHEYAHIALLARDRPYYRSTSQAYARLTPRGSWPSQLPLVGPLIRELAASDTLYHPDAYAHYALAASGRLVEMKEVKEEQQRARSAVWVGETTALPARLQHALHPWLVAAADQGAPETAT